MLYINISLSIFSNMLLTNQSYLCILCASLAQTQRVCTCAPLFHLPYGFHVALAYTSHLFQERRHAVRPVEMAELLSCGISHAGLLGCWEK
jgi:hypothetical protein